MAFRENHNSSLLTNKLKFTLVPYKTMSITLSLYLSVKNKKKKTKQYKTKGNAQYNVR